MPNAFREIPERAAVRAALRYLVVADCWESTYSVASHGYAQIGWSDTVGRYGTTAHRAAWAYWVGQPGHLTVDHLCRNKRCVKPSHLRLLPNLENARRTSGRDWPLGTCINGHDSEHWSPKDDNRIKGYCRECRADQRGARTRLIH